MFAIRQFSYVILKRLCSPFVIRYESTTTTDLIKTSSSDIERKSTIDYTPWATSELNRLINYLSIRIQNVGPITVADFMHEALSNPKYGYNTRHEVYGKKGDFITTPEIRQSYAELLAKWIMQEHSTIGGNVLQLVEMGPGRGLLMNDIIKILKKYKYSNTHTFFALYEKNLLMRQRQAETLLGRSFNPLIANDYRIKDGNYSLIWFDDFKQLLSYDTYFIANEFFNVYPIHKFQKTSKGWKEVMIDWNPITKQLQYVLSLKPTPMIRLYENFLNSIKDRQHIEISPQRAMIMQAMCTHLTTYGGSALIGDYGHWGEKGDTFRAFRKDEIVDPLSDPGNIDIVSDVDFEELSKRGMQVPNVQFFGPISQGNFLYNLGLNKRLTDLTYDKTPEEQEEILNDVEKLVSSEYMGDRFLYICAQRTNKINAPAGSFCFQMPGHFINELNSCVDDSLIGYVRTYDHLELAGRAVITRSPIPSVAVISGNGAGHEPAMVGFVGRGLLSACISGSIFASPPSADIFRLIVETKRRGAKQILLIILNYTGDRLNFGLAMERSRELAIDIDMLVIADDIALNIPIGPRGLAGALLIIKVAGALAEQGKNMTEIVDVCQKIRAHLRTIGLSASGIRAPGHQQSFDLMDDEMELGMGIHGESGVQRLKLLPIRQTIDLALDQLFIGPRTLDLQPDSSVLLFVNNLGGCSNLELGIIVKEAVENLEQRKLNVKRVICGEMMTSFNMKGFSLTLLKLATDMSSSILNLLDAPTDAFAWPKVISPTQSTNSIQALSDSLEFNEQFSSQIVISESPLSFNSSDSELINQALQGIVKRLYSEADELNRLDAVSGDGDTGTAFMRAADAIARDLANKKLVLHRPSSLFRRLGLIAESRMGGTCGAICGLFFAATAKQLSLSNQSQKIIDSLCDAFEAGIQSVESYARVQPGDKSLLDALIPAVDYIKSKRKQQIFTSKDWRELAFVTERATQETRNFIAKVGRAAYTKSVEITVVDPGAKAVSIIIQAICDIFIRANIK
ncbi:unnamed protein product [Rotaria sordida]|uniref:Triokinase/FMN cyclase n=2 Tax=Rotaria sordida TaxID=392033 RepID=A0A818RN49_9BILA|nr:unnamed protein product [Rotaria sordida]